MKGCVSMELVSNLEKLRRYREKAKQLVSQMTLEEKVSQTLHYAAAIDRLGIKAYNWWNEALHGVARAGQATVFPQAIGLAATFDEELMERVADAISTEGRAKFNMQQKYHDTDIYKGLTFWSPNVNIFRDPRWGRGHETFGEDPFLSSRMGVRFVQGIQGHDENFLKAAACAKHFAVHSGPESERHGFDAVVSQQDLYETYLPAFKACVQEARVEAVMGAYNRTNGAPCCGHKELLQDILREKWGFEGHVVSDCGAIGDFHNHHGVTRSAPESAALAMNNGCDLNCGSMFEYLNMAIRKGLVDEKRLDEAVVNLYTTRMKLGVLDKREDNPFDHIPYSVVQSAPMQKLALEAARKSIVLLKNQDALLPLDKSKLKTVGVIGPNANNRNALIGNYEGTAARYVTVLEGIQDYLGEDIRVLTSEGCHLYKDRVQGLGSANDRASEVQEICALSDVVIACMGLDPGLEGEEGDAFNSFASGDKPNLDLPGLQQQTLELIYASGKPVVLVLMSGSALAVNWAQEHVPAILQAWYLGALGGRAVAEILFGEYSPEGKLPVTFYKSTEELPDFKDYSMEGRTYRYMKQDALYPFGYGLSYTDFAVENVRFGANEVTEEGIDVYATLRNVGSVAGAETLQVYVQVQPEKEVSHLPNYQLKGLSKVYLQPGEGRELCIHLPEEAFGLFDEEGRCVIHKGMFRIYAGTHAPDARSLELSLRPSEFVTFCTENEKVIG